jgi:hypothetical protein
MLLACECSTVHMACIPVLGIFTMLLVVQSLLRGTVQDFTATGCATVQNLNALALNGTQRL